MSGRMSRRRRIRGVVGAAVGAGVVLPKPQILNLKP